jgi:hypothetical protein
MLAIPVQCPLLEQQQISIGTALNGLVANDQLQTSGLHDNALPCRLYRSRNVLVLLFVPIGRGYASAFLFRRPECRPHPSHPVDGHRTAQWLDCNHKCIWEVLMLTSFNRWQQIGIVVSAIWFIGFAAYFVEYRLTNDMKSNLHEARDSCDKALQSNNDIAILIERKEDRVTQQA